MLTKLATVGTGIMLARMLGPHSFGIYAVAAVALSVLTNINDLGVSLAIVRWPGEPGEIVPTVSTIAVTTSAVLYAGCYFSAPWYATAMGAPTATIVVRAVSLIVLIDGVAAAPTGLLARSFSQGRRMIADQVNIWLGTALTVALAWAGFGAMSLALGRIAGCLVAAILLVHLSPMPLRLGFNPRIARELLRFGPPLAGSAVISYVIANVDQLVVGRLLGVTALGFFVLASNLSNWPATSFSQPISRVAPATLARLRHDPPAMRAGFQTMAALVAAVTLPVCLVESGVAAPLVRMVYGTRWLPAGQPLMWLAMLAALQIFFQLTYDYFVVLAMSRVVFTLQVVWAIVLVPVLVAGARIFGDAGVALGELAVAAVVPLPWYVFELRKAGIGTRPMAARLGLPLAGAALAGLAAAGISAAAPDALTAVACSAVIGSAVIGLLIYRMREVLQSVRGRSRLTGARQRGDGLRGSEVAAHPGLSAAPVVSLGPPLPASVLRLDGRGAQAVIPPRTPSNPARLPLYEATVDVLGWDPAGHPNPGGRSGE
jgi:O-antigen/teichoic acid export membrane protein